MTEPPIPVPVHSFWCCCNSVLREFNEDVPLANGWKSDADDYLHWRERIGVFSPSYGECC